MRSYSICLSPTDLFHSAWLSQMVEFPHFLWLNNILLHTHTHTHTHTHICHNFFLYPFIHPSTYEHLGCFHVLATVNNAAVNKGICVSFQVNVFTTFEYIPRSGIARSYGSSIFNFWGPSKLFSIVAVPIYNLTKSAQSFPFLHFHASICYLTSFWWWPF